ETIENQGIEVNSAVFPVKLSEFLQLTSVSGISDDVASAFLDRFALSSRPRWDAPPQGFRMKDIYPWRFGRSLSVVARPILKLDSGDDPLLLIAPNNLHRGVAYVV